MVDNETLLEFLKLQITYAVENATDVDILWKVKAFVDEHIPYIPDEDELAQIEQSLKEMERGETVSWEELKAKLERRDFSDGD